MARWAIIGAFVLLGGGCRHHLDRNAPGNVKLVHPPKEIAAERVEWPEDPGEHLFVLTGGGYAGGGFSACHRCNDTLGASAVGLELSAHLGELPISHHQDDFIIYPRMTHGINLGWTFVGGAGEPRWLGPLYLEYQYYRAFWGGAVGFAWNPDEGHHGPQLTFFGGPMFLRLNHLFDESTDVVLGVVFKWPLLSVFWSR